MFHHDDYDESHMDTSGAGYFNNEGNSSTAQASVDKKTQNVMPLCIRQVMDLEEKGGEFQMFNLSVPMVCIVGILRKLEVSSTKATCQIDDLTGEVDAILWLETEMGGVHSIPPVQEGNYVEVFGSIRQQGETRVLVILKIIPVTDCNVITNHLLQVIHARLEAEALDPNAGITNDNPGIALAKSMSAMDDVPREQVEGGLNAIQNKVYKLLMAEDTPQGMHVDNIIAHFGQYMARDVKDALEFLSGEGHIYSTIDTEHFKVTKNC